MLSFHGSLSSATPVTCWPALPRSPSEVIFAFLVAWLWLGEGLDLVQIIGAALVLVGIILTQTARANKVIDAGLAFRA